MTSLLELLAHRGRHQPTTLAYRYLIDGTTEHAIDLTYGELADQALGVADYLGKRGLATPAACRPPDASADEGVSPPRVVLALDPSLEYVAALYGILAAGATAVPAFPPDGKQTMARFRSIVCDCQPKFIIAGPRFANRVGEFEAGLPNGVRPPTWILTERPAAEGIGLRPDHSHAVPDPALLQYTSGSTGEPKGVVVTHANVMSNCHALEHHIGLESDEVGCIWLPPYHDMGLMTIVFALYSGSPLVMMSPVHFVQQPVRWLRAITEYKATTSAIPNFACDLCTDYVAEKDVAQLDLSSLRHMFCGSEPVQSRTLARFRERFSARGYNATALIPCYGLAEATLFVAGKQTGTAITEETVSRVDLEAGVARRVPPGTEAATTVVSCGRIANNHEVVIADPAGSAMPPGRVGEIWISGPSVAAGYFQKPDLTRTVFEASLVGLDQPTKYLRTGDLGFFRDKNLFVTGRIKDLVVIAGRNIYPQDVEQTVREAHHHVRLAAAFAVAGRVSEELIIVAQCRASGGRLLPDYGEVTAAILAAVTAHHGVRPADIHLAPVGAIQKTTSGKVRRGETRAQYLAGTLKKLTPEPALAS